RICRGSPTSITRCGSASRQRATAVGQILRWCGRRTGSRCATISSTRIPRPPSPGSTAPARPRGRANLKERLTVSRAEASEVPSSSVGAPARSGRAQTEPVASTRPRRVSPVRLERDRRPPKASVMLAADIRAHILGHGLPPGSALPSEPQLVSETGLGRATIREALRLLEAEGLITIKRGPHGGVTVRRPDVSRLSRSLAPILTLSEAPLRDLFVFRKAVEPQAAA